jgi:cytochrome c-type biogenesis protein CcmH
MKIAPHAGGSTLITLGFLTLLFSSSLIAGIEDHNFKNPKQEALYTKLIKELRCLVCQNQNLADSNADLAKDLRKKTYEMVIADKTRDQITDYMITRYGDFVLYRPPVNKSTYFLWLGPFAFLILAIGTLIFIMRRKTSSTQLPPVPSDDLANAREHLDR